EEFLAEGAEDAEIEEVTGTMLLN
ncbi:MAG: hypothetical protein JWR87_446, partial [Segetibacter sp.]|nr:hypothetical protein [Segetibacter sp.]